MSNWTEDETPTAETVRARVLTERDKGGEVTRPPRSPDAGEGVTVLSGGSSAPRSVSTLDAARFDRFGEIIDALREWSELGAFEQTRQDADWWAHATSDLAAEVINLRARLAQVRALTELVQ